MPHHGLAVEVQQQLLGAAHARARARREDHRADREQRCGKALARRSRRADPLHLGRGLRRGLGEIVQARAVGVDRDDLAPSERRQVGDGIRHANDRERRAVGSRGDMLQRRHHVASAHDHAVRTVGLAVCAPSDGHLEVAHDEDGHASSMPECAAGLG